MPSYPFTPGFEAAGIVRKVGKRVKRFKEGDVVIAGMGKDLGGHAMLSNVPERARSF